MKSSGNLSILRFTETLSSAYAIHPERFVRKAPAPALLPGAVWINPPQNPKTAGNGGDDEKTEPQDRIGPRFSESDDLNILPKSHRIMVSGNPKFAEDQKEVAIATLN